MKDIYKELCDILKQDTRFVDDNGNLLKNKIQECGNNLDEDLLRLLLTDKLTESMFFRDVNGIKVFDKVEFAFVVNSKQFLPDSYTKFCQNIILTDEYGQSIKKNNDVVLEFPHKDCILEFDSTTETDNRDEVYLNEVMAKSEIDTLLAPKVFSNIERHKKEGVSKETNFSLADNLVIKGNNLIGLYSLFPIYKGQIRLMYWDILYNTKNDHVPYNDSFKHSTWLTMMKNRLEIAKELLSSDGSICLQCDDNEQAYLKVLCDEIFGRDNFVNCIAVKTSEASGVKMSHVENKLPKIKDYLLIYKKGQLSIKPPIISKMNNLNEFANYAKYYSNIIENIEEKPRNWIITPIKEYIKKHNLDISTNEEILKFKLDNSEKVIYRTNNATLSKMTFSTKTEKVISPTGLEYIWWEGKQMLFLKDYTNEYLCDFWPDISTINLNKEGGVELKNAKKPESLIKRILEMLSNENDIVLDAYFGTGTTGAVAMKMGRRFIGLEQLDSHYQKSIMRLTNVVNGEQSGISKEVNWQGGESFVSMELADSSNALLKRIECSGDEQLKNIYYELKSSDFVLYRVDINAMDKNADAFTELSVEDKKKFLISIIDKNHLYINYSDIDNADYEISGDDKRFTRNFYSGGEK